MRNINEIFSELAQYKRLQEETKAIIEGLQNEVIDILTAKNTDTITGNEHKASYKLVTQNKVDTTALKAQHPDIVKQFTKASSYYRFNFS